MCVNINKCKAMIISTTENTINSDKAQKIKINNACLEYIDKFKYLGVIVELTV